MNQTNEEKFKRVRLLAMDFDGIMTDGKVYVDQDGQEMVKCSRKDGLGIELLKKYGLDAVVISKETNPVVAVRCQKLEIEYEQGAENSERKLDIVKRIAAERGIDLSEMAYMGDDLNDRAVLENVGLAITVADGHPDIKKVCDYITAAKGGGHAVREVCEKILEAKGIKLEF